MLWSGRHAIRGRNPLLLGINGAQGTGKSTRADFFRLASKSIFDWNTAVLSIDDFYYTLEEREKLSQEVHPLLQTRGVPGTHDTGTLTHYLKRLRQVDDNEFVALPVNSLERDEDPDGTWRNYFNDQLKASYGQIFAQLDTLVFLRATSLGAILRWRLEHEVKLAEVAPAGSPALMSETEIVRFIEFYERLTRSNLTTRIRGQFTYLLLSPAVTFCRFLGTIR